MSYIENHLRKLETQLQPTEKDTEEDLFERWCRLGAAGPLPLLIAEMRADHDERQAATEAAVRERVGPEEYERILAKAKRLAAEYLQK